MNIDSIQNGVVLDLSLIHILPWPERHAVPFQRMSTATCLEKQKLWI